MPRLEAIQVNGRYANPAFLEPGNAPREGDFKDFRRWRRERKALPKPPPPNVPRVDAPSVPDAPREGWCATWAGHSSTLLQLDGQRYLLDPIWSARAGGVVKRLTEVGIPWRDVPEPDALLLSHDHYDHMDTPTLRKLDRGTAVVCPKGVGAWFRKRGFQRTTELSWWQSVAIGEHKVTLVPAQHFSGRLPWDRNRTLWGGFVVEGDRGTKAYYAGDSGYFKGFAQIGEAFPDIDLCVMPIGAYLPRWFMSPVHVDPPEATQAFLDVGAKHMLPVHWGAFRLADEPVDEPPRALAEVWKLRGLDPARLHVAALGETVRA